MDKREVVQNKNHEHSKKMNEEAIKKIQEEEETKNEKTPTLSLEEANRLEAVFFEDDEEITLRNGIKYKIAPCVLKDARKLMQLLKTVNVDAIILNFVPTGDDAVDADREDKLMQILDIAFKHYDLDKDTLMEFVDLEMARQIVELMIGLNGLKK